MEDYYIGSCTDESIEFVVYEYIDDLEDYPFGNKIKL